MCKPAYIYLFHLFLYKSTLEILTSLLQHRANAVITNATRHSGQLCENVTSSTKPEVHNVLHYRQRRKEDQATATDNMYRKFREVWTCF